MTEVDVTKYGFVVMLAAFSLADFSHAAGLCESNEQTIFNCELKESKKFVSMCASKNLSNNQGFLQYRYGLPNKIELKFPENLENSRQQFGYDEYSRPDLTTFVVGFNNGGFRYEISETTEGSDADGVTTRSLLVSSEKRKRGSRLTCLDNKNAVSSISTLDQVLRCDRGHEIVEGACD